MVYGWPMYGIVGKEVLREIEAHYCWCDIKQWDAQDEERGMTVILLQLGI